MSGQARVVQCCGQSGTGGPIFSQNLVCVVRDREYHQISHSCLHASQWRERKKLRLAGGHRERERARVEQRVTHASLGCSVLRAGAGGGSQSTGNMLG